jgi:hypothetical protein
MQEGIAPDDPFQFFYRITSCLFFRGGDGMERSATIVDRGIMKDAFVYTVLDENSHSHSVLIPSKILRVEPRGFIRGTDEEHLETLALGAVLISLDPDSTFHRVDPETVTRAYAAAQVHSFDRTRVNS